MPSSVVSSYGWKHGYPDKCDAIQEAIIKNKPIGNIIFIFIIRDLEPWLKSMFKNPYHYTIPSSNITDFIRNPLQIDEADETCVVNTDIREQQDIISIRNGKIRKYWELFESSIIKNGIIINLEKVQKNKGVKLIQLLNNSYHVDIVPTFVPVDTHTKTNDTNIVNRKYDDVVSLPSEIIKEKIDNEVERFVYNLKIKPFIRMV